MFNRAGQNAGLVINKWERLVSGRRWKENGEEPIPPIPAASYLLSECYLYFQISPVVQAP